MSGVMQIQPRRMFSLTNNKILLYLHVWGITWLSWTTKQPWQQCRYCGVHICGNGSIINTFVCKHLFIYRQWRRAVLVWRICSWLEQLFYMLNFRWRHLPAAESHAWSDHGFAILDSSLSTAPCCLKHGGKYYNYYYTVNLLSSIS